MAKEHIAVRVPCGDGINPALASTLVTLKGLNAEPTCPYRFTIGVFSGIRPADYARNVIVKEVLETDASRLWFIDSDVKPSENCIQILKWSGDIVAGIYPMWGQLHRDIPETPSVHWCVYDRKDDTFISQTILEQGVVSCGAAGTGMMVIRRKVLEDERMYHSREYIGLGGKMMTLPDDAPPPLFKEIHAPNGRFDSTEDIDFCFRAADLGYTIKADHGVKCGHMKVTDVKDVASYAVECVNYGIRRGIIDMVERQHEEKGRLVLAS